MVRSEENLDETMSWRPALRYDCALKDKGGIYAESAARCRVTGDWHGDCLDIAGCQRASGEFHDGADSLGILWRGGSYRRHIASILCEPGAQAGLRLAAMSHFPEEEQCMFREPASKQGVDCGNFLERMQPLELK